MDGESGAGKSLSLSADRHSRPPQASSGFAKGPSLQRPSTHGPEPPRASPLPPADDRGRVTSACRTIERPSDGMAKRRPRGSASPASAEFAASLDGWAVSTCSPRRPPNRAHRRRELRWVEHVSRNDPSETSDRIPVLLARRQAADRSDRLASSPPAQPCAVRRTGASRRHRVRREPARSITAGGRTFDRRPSVKRTRGRARRSRIRRRSCADHLDGIRHKAAARHPHGGRPPGLRGRSRCCANRRSGDARSRPPPGVRRRIFRARAGVD